ncbi:MAG TPA: amino acid permease, partial [Chitinophagaceae bacterium]|nr:amino acid permease [Chitinophagaceae bacterium]
NIPKSMFISVAGIAVLYILMNISVASVLPLNKIIQSPFIVSEFMQTLAGPVAATIVTALILWVAFASVFSATLGYSRIPYAAAKDGAFFSIFAKLHTAKHFPYVSLLALGGVAFVFSLVFQDIKKVVSAILAMRILIQFIGQAIGLIILSKRKGRNFLKWKMLLYPLPVILAIIMWLYIFVSTSMQMASSGVIVIMAGVIVYLIKARHNKEWPFQTKSFS